MSKANEATSLMEKWAADDKHNGYDQIFRWGEKGDYDCSSGVITAWQKVGVGVKSAGATYTGDMKAIFLRCGFEDVTKKVDVLNGKGLVRGDVLLNERHHVAMYCGDGKEVEFSINEKGTATGGKPGDQTGKECLVRNYRNYPWDCVLRYKEPKQKPDGKNIVDYPARMLKNTMCYLNVNGMSSKMFPMLKEGSLVDVMKYTEEDAKGHMWHLVRIPHPTEGFVFEFVKSGTFKRL